MPYRRFITIAIFVMAASVAGQDIFTLIQRGDLDEARAMLGSRDPMTLTDGNLLYCAGLLEPNADRAAALFARAVDFSPREPFREEAVAKLVQYHYLRGNKERLGQTVAQYFGQYPEGNSRRQIERYSVLLAQLSDQHDVAIRQADRYLTAYTSGEMVQWLAIDKARSMQAMGKHIGAAKILRNLSKETTGPGVPVSLYMLAVSAAETNKSDEAVLYYNLLDEAYPSSVGLDALMERLTKSSEAVASDDRAEQLTSTFYSVKVGVFSEKANASNMARLVTSILKSPRIEIEPKTISGRSYQVVYVGRFRSFTEAQELKQKLEAELGESFQVVAR